MYKGSFGQLGQTTGRWLLEGLRVGLTDALVGQWVLCGLPLQPLPSLLLLLFLLRLLSPHPPLSAEELAADRTKQSVSQMMEKDENLLLITQNSESDDGKRRELVVDQTNQSVRQMTGKDENLLLITQNCESNDGKRSELVVDRTMGQMTGNDENLLLITQKQ